MNEYHVINKREGRVIDLIEADCGNCAQHEFFKRGYNLKEHELLIPVEIDRVKSPTHCSERNILLK